MHNEALLSRVRALISKFIGVPEHLLGLDASREKFASWDSVANLGILTELEEEFSVEITTRDAMRLGTLADITRFVEERTTSS